MYNIHPHTYSFIYFHFLLIVVLVTDLLLVGGQYKKFATGKEAFIFALGILLIIGLRPYNVPGVGSYFGDTINYYHSFMRAESGYYSLWDRGDIGFNIFTQFCAKYLNAGAYFFILAGLYVLPAYYACRKLSSNFTFLLFLIFVSSLLFWAYGVNGIRSGVGSSFVFLGLTYRDKKWVQVLLFVLAVAFHRSMLLPTMAYVLTFFYKDSKGYIGAWFVSIVLSLMFGGFWENLFAGFNVGDERLVNYLTTQPDANYFAYTGFRWDFLIYSSIPVALGAHFIYKKHYSEIFYIQLFNTYLLANSFWILVIRANFSNRFAALSWFLIPIVILLPLIKIRIWKMQMAKIGLILFLTFAFTYYMSFTLLWR